MAVGTTAATWFSEGARHLPLQEGAIEGADDGFDRGEFDVGVDAGTVVRAASRNLYLDIRNCPGLRAFTERVLDVVEHLELRQSGFTERADKRVERAVAFADQSHRLTVDAEPRITRDQAIALKRLELLQGDGGFAIQVFALEGFMDLRRGEFAAGGISEVIDDLADFLVHQLGQLVAEFLFENVGHSTFAGLTVDANDRFVAAADIRRIDRDVENVPRLARFLGSPGFLDVSR